MSSINLDNKLVNSMNSMKTPRFWGLLGLGLLIIVYLFTALFYKKPTIQNQTVNNYYGVEK